MILILAIAVRSITDTIVAINQDAMANAETTEEEVYDASELKTFIATVQSLSSIYNGAFSGTDLNKYSDNSIVSAAQQYLATRKLIKTMIADRNKLVKDLEYLKNNYENVTFDTRTMINFYGYTSFYNVLRLHLNYGKVWMAYFKDQLDKDTVEFNALMQDMFSCINFYNEAYLQFKEHLDVLQGTHDKSDDEVLENYLFVDAILALFPTAVVVSANVLYCGTLINETIDKMSAHRLIVLQHLKDIQFYLEKEEEAIAESERRKKTEIENQSNANFANRAGLFLVSIFSYFIF